LEGKLWKKAELEGGEFRKMPSMQNEGRLSRGGKPVVKKPQKRGGNARRL